MTPSNQLAIPLARSAPNFAPIDPIRRVLQNKKLSKEPTKFEQSVKELYTGKMKYNEAAWNELISMAQLVALFRQGQQLLRRRPFGVGYYVQPIANDDTYRQLAMNMMGFHAQVCESKIVASNPSVNMRAGDDTPEAIAAAQACRPVVDYYETEWYTSKFTRREAIDLLTNGMFIHRVRWNPFKGGMTVQERQVTQREPQNLDDGYGECAECSFAATAQDFSQGCPECGSEAVDVKEPNVRSLSQITMGPSRPVGEPEIIRTPFPAWRWDLSKDLEDSSWAIYRQRITQGVINLMLGNVTIPNSDSSTDYGLEVLHALSYAGQAFEGKSTTSTYGGDSQNDRRPTMCEFWMSREDYAEIEVEEGDTVCGQTLPKGRLSDFFKDPICIVGLNDMSLVVGVYTNESHQNEVVTGQWIMQSDSGAGRGMEDSAAVQRRANAVDGQIYQGLAMTATPAVITDKRLLKEDTAGYLFKPGTTVDINLSLLPPNLGLKDAFYLGQPGNVSQQYIQYGTEYLKQMADMSSFAVEFSNLLSIDNRTATGAQISAALANSLYGPMLATKGQARVRIAQMIVALEASHNITDRFFPGKGAAKGRSVNARELKGKVLFELVANSELPVTPFSRQTDVRVMVESLGGPQGILLLKQQEPEMFKQLASPFNYKPAMDEEDSINTLCLERLEQIKSNFQAGVDDATMLVEGLRPPVSLYEPKHAEKKGWWSKYLDLQQGQAASQTIRQAAEQMFILHQNMETQVKLPQATNEGLLVGVNQAAAQAPSALGANALGAGDNGQQQQAEHDAQEQHKDRELEVATHLSDQQHETRMKEMEGKTQLEITKQQGENQKAAAKARPKPSASKAA